MYVISACLQQVEEWMQLLFFDNALDLELLPGFKNNPNTENRARSVNVKGVNGIL